MHWLSQLIARMTILYLGVVLDLSRTCLCRRLPPTLPFPQPSPSRPTPSFPSPLPPFFQGPSTRSGRRRRYPALAQHTTGAGRGRHHCCESCDRATGGPEPASLLARRDPTPAPQTTEVCATAATCGPEPEPLLARGPAVAAPGGEEIKQWLTPWLCRTCKRRSYQAASRDEPDQPRAGSSFQQEKCLDIDAYKRMNIRI